MGRLIDADALKEELMKVNFTTIDYDRLIAIDVVNSMPTIDTDNDDDIYENDVCIFCGKLKNFEDYGFVEQKVGKWIPMTVSSGRDSWKCSLCGRRARGKIENLPYCHCGAKMEGAEE